MGAMGLHLQTKRCCRGMDVQLHLGDRPANAMPRAWGEERLGLSWARPPCHAAAWATGGAMGDILVGRPPR
jgi:hypothetical protein